MSVQLYGVMIILSLICLVVMFATGAFFSKSVGPPLGLAVVVTAGFGIFLAASVGSVISVIFIILGILFLIVGALMGLASLGGE